MSTGAHGIPSLDPSRVEGLAKAKRSLNAVIHTGTEDVDHWWSHKDADGGLLPRNVAMLSTPFAKVLDLPPQQVPATTLVGGTEITVQIDPQQMGKVTDLNLKFKLVNSDGTDAAIPPPMIGSIFQTAWLETDGGNRSTQQLDGFAEFFQKVWLASDIEELLTRKAEYNLPSTYSATTGIYCQADYTSTAVRTLAASATSDPYLVPLKGFLLAEPGIVFSAIENGSKVNLRLKLNPGGVAATGTTAGAHDGVMILDAASVKLEVAYDAAGIDVITAIKNFVHSHDLHVVKWVPKVKHFTGTTLTSGSQSTFDLDPIKGTCGFMTIAIRAPSGANAENPNVTGGSNTAPTGMSKINFSSIGANATINIRDKETEENTLAVQSLTLRQLHYRYAEFVGSDDFNIYAYSGDNAKYGLIPVCFGGHGVKKEFWNNGTRGIYTLPLDENDQVVIVPAATVSNCTVTITCWVLSEIEIQKGVPGVTKTI